MVLYQKQCYNAAHGNIAITICYKLMNNWQIDVSFEVIKQNNVKIIDKVVSRDKLHHYLVIIITKKFKLRHSGKLLAAVNIFRNLYV